jgi:hypothetical protein
MWDGTTFSDFTVVWDGVTFDETSSANSPILGSGTSCTGSSVSTPALGFAILSQSLTGCDTDLNSEWQGATSGGLPQEFLFFSFFPAYGNFPYINAGVGANAGLAEGTFSITEVTSGAPEPEARVLTLIGLGFTLFLRKRMCF